MLTLKIVCIEKFGTIDLWMWDYNSYNSQAGTQTTSEDDPSRTNQDLPNMAISQKSKNPGSLLFTTK